jgi:hypothetical protein
MLYNDWIWRNKPKPWRRRQLNPPTVGVGFNKQNAPWQGIRRVLYPLERNCF